jgi:hypothetical protein
MRTAYKTITPCGDTDRWTLTSKGTALQRSKWLPRNPDTTVRTDGVDRKEILADRESRPVGCENH